MLAAGRGGGTHKQQMACWLCRGVWSVVLEGTARRPFSPVRPRTCADGDTVAGGGRPGGPAGSDGTAHGAGAFSVRDTGRAAGVRAEAPYRPGRMRCCMAALLQSYTRACGRRECGRKGACTLAGFSLNPNDQCRIVQSCAALQIMAAAAMAAAMRRPWVTVPHLLMSSELQLQ